MALPFHRLAFRGNKKNFRRREDAAARGYVGYGDSSIDRGKRNLEGEWFFDRISVNNFRILWDEKIAGCGGFGGNT